VRPTNANENTRRGHVIPLSNFFPNFDDHPTFQATSIMREVLSLVCLHVDLTCARVFADCGASFCSTYDHSLNGLLDSDPSRLSLLDRSSWCPDWQCLLYVPISLRGTLSVAARSSITACSRMSRSVGELYTIEHGLSVSHLSRMYRFRSRL
jgi:hypothetical protein